MIPTVSNYWLKNAQIPVCLLSNVVLEQTPNREGLVNVDLEIASGVIRQIVASGTVETRETPTVNLHKKQVWPCFVDIHTHLDKGHIWERTPNPDGTFHGALKAVWKDIEVWNFEDVYRRMEFGLKCSYAHGTKAIRTHLDSGGRLADISWEAFRSLQKEWSDKLILQAVALVTLEEYLTAAGEKLADKVAEFGGILGGVAYMNPEIDRQIERVFELAKDRNLDLDFHTDENGDPDSITLKKVAETALKSDFSGKIVCGHCCSLAVQSPEQVTETIALVKQAGIGIISLPMCNLYLQDRQYQQQLNLTQTPRWRGVTLLHELKQSEIAVAVASDNCRDPFYGFGDHDGLEVFKMAVRIAHLDHPFGDWPQAVTQTSAELMGLSNIGKIGVGLPADLIIFQGRYFSEILSRSQHDRIVLRKGKEINTTLPDYQELDDLIG
ncbi:amidohydrolase family protein [Lyngbya aestuarii BL J]|uniref:Amidohydrolase family protein n=1 Tax=Lyngbya aestuarii BL J TaxID=1348334 RepID=U7QC60_9CYAN|nr:cytosine deaminase [Lyngbya aestuarii]ERT04802.1 amidohydrolase family protein [Lyngbya aestuarii BL J]